MTVSEVRGLITAAIRELGLDSSQPLMEVALLRDGHFAGWRFEGGEFTAVWLAGAGQIRLESHGATKVKTIQLSAASNQAA